MFDINYPYEHGISIDIFVIENVASSALFRYIDSFLSNLFKFGATSILFYKYPNPLVRKMFSLSFISRLYYASRRALGCLFSVITHKRLLKWYDGMISRHPNTDMVTIPTGTRLYSGEMLPKEVWKPYSKATFSGVEVNIPNKADIYLKNLYGDNYMQIPPTEKRETHFVVKLKF